MGACFGTQKAVDVDIESDEEERLYGFGSDILNLLKNANIADAIAGFLADWEILHVFAFKVGSSFHVTPETLAIIYNDETAQNKWEDLMMSTIAELPRLHSRRSAFMHSVKCRYCVPWDSEEREFKSTFTSIIQHGILQEFFWMMQDTERFRRKYDGFDSAHELIRTLLIGCGGLLSGPDMDNVKHLEDVHENEKIIIPTQMFSKSFKFLLHDQNAIQFEEEMHPEYVAPTPGLRSSLMETQKTIILDSSAIHMGTPYLNASPTLSPTNKSPRKILSAGSSSSKLLSVDSDMSPV